MKENEFKENFKRAKNLYNALKKDDESVLFASEKINKQLIKKIKRSKYEKDIIFLKARKCKFRRERRDTNFCTIYRK